MILALDPSIKSAGFALFRSGYLVHAARVTLKADTAQDPAAREYEMAERIVRAAREHHTHTTWIVSERPQIYARAKGKTKADPNKLLYMVGVTAAVRAMVGVPITTYLPAEWKRQLRVEALVEVVRACLTPEELALLPDSHDAAHAVGVGLHFLGRLRLPRVYPGASAEPPPDGQARVVRVTTARKPRKPKRPVR